MPIPNRYGGIDFNLFATFDAVMEHRNLTRAARALNTSQPAVSRALARLRQHFDDPLFLRAPGGVEPTARAEALALEIGNAIETLASAGRGEPDFDPATARAEVTLLLTDMLAWLLLPPLAQRLAEQAPGIELRCVGFSADTVADELRRRHLSLAFASSAMPLAGASRAALYEDDFVCLVSRRHSVVRTRLTLPQFVRFPHVLVTPLGQRLSKGPVDQALARVGKKRRVAVSVPHFVVAPEVVRDSDYILTLPRRLALRVADRFELALHRPPFPLPGFEMSAFWYPRYDDAPVHRWLRAQVGELLGVSTR